MKTTTESEVIHMEAAASEYVNDEKDFGKPDLDEAVEVIAKYTGPQSWTPEEETRLVRKIDKRLLVILVLTFALQFYDKVLLSHAALFGLRDDLHLGVGNRYSMASSIFYLGFIVGSYPAGLLAQRFPIQRVIFTLVLFWGLCVVAAAGCTNYRGLYTQRFFLGLLEAGVSPVWMMVVGGWYTKHGQTLRMAVWFAAAPMVSIPAPLINYGLGHITGALAPWRYMFIVAGSITVIWAFVILFFMESDPIHVKSLNDREKYIAVSRLKTNNAGVRNTHFKREQVFELMRSAKFWLLFAMSITLSTVPTVQTVFSPLIIRSMGFTGFNALLLTMPAGALGAVATVGTAWGIQKTSKHNLRTIVLVVEVLLMLLACCLMWQLPNMTSGGKLVCIYVLALYPPTYALLMHLSIANTAGYTKRTLTSSGVFVGYCIGNFVCPLTFLESEIGRYSTGWTFIASVLAGTVVFTLLYRLSCVRVNRGRNDAGFNESFDHAYEDDITDKRNPQFGYIY